MRVRRLLDQFLSRLLSVYFVMKLQSCHHDPNEIVYMRTPKPLKKKNFKEFFLD